MEKFDRVIGMKKKKVVLKINESDWWSKVASSRYFDCLNNAQHARKHKNGYVYIVFHPNQNPNHIESNIENLKLAKVSCKAFRI